MKATARAAGLIGLYVITQQWAATDGRPFFVRPKIPRGAPARSSGRVSNPYSVKPAAHAGASVNALCVNAATVSAV